MNRQIENRLLNSKCNSYQKKITSEFEYKLKKCHFAKLISNLMTKFDCWWEKKHKLTDKLTKKSLVRQLMISIKGFDHLPAKISKYRFLNGQNTDSHRQLCLGRRKRIADYNHAVACPPRKVRINGGQLSLWSNQRYSVQATRRGGAPYGAAWQGGGGSPGSPKK